MKILIAAALLTVASPAFAQSADPHSGHPQGQHEEHEQHKDCCDHKNPDGTPMECCKAAEDGTRPACCDKHGEGDDAHAGHDMSKH